MLDDIRTKVRGPWAVAVVLFISIPFIFFGVESLFSMVGKADDAVSVGSQDFSEQYIQNMIENEARGNPSADRGQIRQQVINRVVDGALLEETAKEMNLHVSDAEVDRSISQEPQFQQNGSFSQEAFDGFLRSQNLTGKRYRDYVRSNLTSRQVASLFEQSEFTTPVELDESSVLFNQKRSGKIYRASLVDKMAAIKVSDAEKQAYYDDNTSQFMTEEQVQVEYIELKKSDIKVDVSDDELKQRHEQNVAQLDKQVEKEYAHIMLLKKDGVDRAQEIQAIRQSLVAGKSFAEIAKEKSEDEGTKNKGGSLASIDFSSLPEEFVTGAESLSKEGELSDVIETPSALHIVTLSSLKQPTVPSFADSKAKLLAELTSTKRNDRFTEQLDELVDISFNADDLKEPASTLKLDIKTSSTFSRVKGDDEFAKNPKVLSAAFSDEVLSDGNNSDAIELADGHVVVLRLKNKVPSEQKSLATVSNDVEAALKRQKAMENIEALQEPLLAAVKANTADADITKQFGVKVSPFTDMSMTDRNSGLSIEVNRSLFNIAKPAEGATNTDSIKDGDDVVVIALNKVSVPNISEIPAEQKDVLKFTLEQFIRMDSEKSFKESMKKSVKIRVRSSETSEDA